MARRVTIILDDDLDKKIHFKQAALIKKCLKSISFSSTLNDILRKSLK